MSDQHGTGELIIDLVEENMSEEESSAGDETREFFTEDPADLGEVEDDGAGAPDARADVLTVGTSSVPLDLSFFVPYGVSYTYVVVVSIPMY